MISFEKKLKEKLKNPEFKEAYEKEKKIIEIAMQVKKSREEEGLSQQELAKKAHITQQQLSKIENAENCNIATFIKVINALHLQMTLIHQKV